LGLEAQREATISSEISTTELATITPTTEVARVATTRDMATPATATPDTTMAVDTEAEEDRPGDTAVNITMAMAVATRQDTDLATETGITAATV
jgi:hypothetical protein